MADPFVQVAQDGPDPFSQVQPTPTPPPTPTTTTRQGAVAAVASVNPGADILAQYTAANQSYQQAVANGQGAVLAQSLAARQQQEEIDGLNRLRYQSNPQDQVNLDAVAHAAMQSAQIDIQRRAESAIERQAVTNIQDAAARGDITQARLLFHNLRDGGPDQVINDINTRRLIMQREIENAQVREQDQGWFAHAANFVMSAIPLHGTWARNGAVVVDQSMRHWYDFLAGGERTNNEHETLWNLPPDQFATFVRNELIPGIRQRSTFLGLENRSQELSILTSLNRNQPAWQRNSFDLLDNLGWIPPSWGLRAISLPALLIRAGGRREAEALIAGAVSNTIRAGAENTVKTLGVTAEDIEANTLATAVNPIGADSVVSSSGDIAAHLARTESLLKDALPTLVAGRFANDAERQAAITSAEQTVIRAMGRDVKDVAVTRTTRPVLSGAPVLETTFTVGRKTGGGYATAKSAARAAAQEGYALAEIIDNTPTTALEEAHPQTTLRVARRDIQVNREITGPDGQVRTMTTTESVPDHIVSETQPTATVVRDQSGQYFFRVTHNIRETGFYTGSPNSGSNLFSRFLFGPNHLKDQMLTGLSLNAGNNRSRFITAWIKPRERVLQRLSGDERVFVNQVLKLGGNDARWWSEDELHQIAQRAFGRNATAREVAGYQTMRELNDAEYLLHRDARWVSGAVKGYETVSFDAMIARAERMNAIVDRELKAAPPGDIYDVANKIHYGRTNPLTPEKLEELRNAGMHAVTFEEPVHLADGTTRKTFVGRPSDFTYEPLKIEQLPYYPGGHRLYVGRYFSKQTVFGVQGDTASRFLMNPATHITGTRAEVLAWNRVMEEARLAWNAKAGPDEIARILGDRPGVPTAEELIFAFENPGTHGFQPDTPFETLFDRQMPAEYARAQKSPFDMYNDDESGLIGYLRTNNRLYTARKGEHLPDWLGNEAPTLDAFKSINQSLQHVASLSSFNDFKTSVIERWADSFGSFIDPATVPGNASPWYKFMHGEIRQGVDEGIRQTAYAKREAIQRILGWKSEGDFQAQHIQQGFENWVMGKDPTSIRHTVGNVASNWWNERNPVNGLRKFATDLHLGLFNLGQLPLQASTMFAALSLRPGLGLKGFAVAPFLRYYLRHSATEADLDLLISRGVHAATGLDATEFKDMMTIGRQSGFFDFANNHALVNQWGPRSAMGSFGVGVDTLMQAGRFPWNEGEMWNRAVAWRIAWGEARETLPTALARSEEFIRTVQTLSEKYSFSMSQQSSAFWQQGVWSIPTQFWSYNIRMMEMMLGPQTTLRQKVQLILGQTLLAGSAGFPPFYLASQIYQRQTGHAPGMDSPIWGTLDRGMLDRLLYEATGGANGGVDARIGARIGTGNWLPDTIGSIFGWSQYGEKSPADFLGGAGLSTYSQIGGSLWDIARYSLAEGGTPTNNALTRDAVLRLAMTASSFSNFTKAMLIQRYGEYISNPGNPLMNDVPHQDAFAQALGFTPGLMNSLSASSLHLKAEDAQINDAVSNFRRFRTRLLNEPDRQEQIMEEINLYSRLLPERIRAEALRRAHSQTDPSLYANFARQIQQHESQDALQHQLEQAQ